MRPRTLALAVLAAVTFLAGCGDDDDSAEQADRDPTERVADDGTTESGEDASLPDGVAASVGDEEISAASIDDHVDALAADPQLAEQLDGPDGDVARTQLRAQILSNAVQTAILAAGADAAGAPVTDEDLSAARDQIEEQAGGADGLDAAMEEQGLTEDLLELQLRSVAAVQNITEALDAEAGDDGSTDTTPDDTSPEDGELSPSEQRVQDFLLEQVSATDIRVHPDFGRWDAQTGQVLPPGAAPGPGG
jgi:hypothetical protein